MPKNKEVLLVFYDLPVGSGTERKENAKFRKELIRHGYIIVQKSVYAKLLHNYSGISTDLEFLRREAPKEGSVSTLQMSLKVFEKMEVISGSNFDMSLFADDIIII